MVNRVKIGKDVDFRNLETALMKAAEEIGWKVEVEDEFKEDYELSGSKSVKEYQYTIVKLKKGLFPQMKLLITDKNRPINSFSIWQGLPFGVASQKSIKNYLDTVSRYI